MKLAVITVMGCLALLAPEAPKGSGLAGTVDAPAPPPSDKAPAPQAPDHEMLELRSKVSQLMFVTLEGRVKPTASDRRLLTEYTPGGVVIPAMTTPELAADYITALRSMSAETRTRVPFFIAADVYSLIERDRGAQSAFAQLPSLLSVAAAGDVDAPKRLGELIAAHLVAMGFNMNLGPSLELAPALPDVRGNVNTFGSSPEFAAEAGGSVIAALVEAGLLVMPTGFPGGGGNRQGNTPAVLLTPRARLAQNDLFPYVQAIEAGASCIHVGNTLVPTIDPANRPASVSRVVMRDLLRGEMKFQGLIVAGPMDVPDIQRTMDSSQAALEALEAGADMILWNQAGERVMMTVDAIVRAVQEGKLERSVLESARQRVLNVKSEHKLIERELPKPRKAEALKKKKYPEETYEIERRSITLLQNRGDVLPLAKDRSMPVGVTGVVATEELQKALEKSMKPISRQPILTAKQLGDIEDFEIDRVLNLAKNLRTIVCVLPNLRKTDGEARLIRALKQKGVAVVVVLLGYPDAVPLVADADAILCAYSEPASYDETIKAVADALVGEGSLGVLRPARDLETKVGTVESMNALDVLRCPGGRLPVSLDEPFVAGFAISCAPTYVVKKAEWDFGDGTQTKGLKVDHAYKTPGRYPIKLTVTDGKKQTASGLFYAAVE